MGRRQLADVCEEARLVLGEAVVQDVRLRAIGGVAIGILCPSASRPPLAREYMDIDLVGELRQRSRIDALLITLGYQPHSEFNSLHGRRRLLYFDQANGRQLDVFLDQFEMCHRLDLRARLTLADNTLDPADLLLTKLQVFETNERDLKDAIALLLDCSIDADRVAAVLAADWGWWRTATDVCSKIERYLSFIPEFDRAAEAQARVDELSARIEAEPKSLRWKMRARIGDRVRWYESPEEKEEEG